MFANLGFVWLAGVIVVVFFVALGLGLFSHEYEPLDVSIYFVIFAATILWPVVLLSYCVCTPFVLTYKLARSRHTARAK